MTELNELETLAAKVRGAENIQKAAELIEKYTNVEKYIDEVYKQGYIDNGIEQLVNKPKEVK